MSELYQLNIDELQVLYQKEVNHLKKDLLAGASWDSVRDQKNKVTELAILIHKKSIRYILTLPNFHLQEVRKMIARGSYY